jgi:hypothetical protein
MNRMLCLGLLLWFISLPTILAPGYEEIVKSH